MGLTTTTLNVFKDLFLLAIFAASWDLLVGRTGQISLGHALFWGIGGYSTAILYRFFKVQPWITIPLAVLIGVSISLLIGLPCIRVKGPYLALVTMAFPIILQYLVNYAPLTRITGGQAGIKVPNLISTTFFSRMGFTLREAIFARAFATYYVALILLFVSAIVLYKIANSKLGIVFVSILDDEVASKASGIDIVRYKLMAFAISSLFASLAGAVAAHLTTSSIAIVNSTFFALGTSFNAIFVTILGGIGTIFGPLVGAHIYYFLNNYILEELITIPVELAAVKTLIFAAVVIVLIIKWPRGMATFITDKLEDLEEARDIEERGKWIWKTYRKK